ncbi:DegV family EDD domain-containing protein [Epidermidibacterium keratini]|uniref:DegV family EDD domain-containing protein n=1 Tax=Epidermidibacterium keratini TaxID=1891644 RepID=A0A7L4YJW1_9ACTN|nr:DegV family protein [Epidermidibacterium keratini]QHB99347.1 DegV family EDD domain-containing protein [Epidermidibacterium keratini]
MAQGIVVVTDSTAYLPADAIAALPIEIVPLHVIMGDESGADGIEVTPEDVVRALGDRSISVSTSRPTPEQFVQTYQRLLDAGYERIVSVHISSELSGTWDAARLAAQQINGDYDGDIVRVVDSRLAAMALGFPVLMAARRAAAGGTLDEVYETAVAASEHPTNIFYVDTLEYLRRGGRIGAAQALVGTALAVKPLLHLQDGRIVPLEKVRTSARAIARMKAIAVEAARAESGQVLVAVHHLAAREKAEALREELVEAIPNADEILISEIGAVLGAHVGPGMLAIIVVPVGDPAGIEPAAS